MSGKIEGVKDMEIVKLMLLRPILPEHNVISSSEVVLLLASEEEAARLLPYGHFYKGEYTIV